MGFLFGHLYDSQCKFTHDQAMFRRMASVVATDSKSRPVSPRQVSTPNVAGEGVATSDHSLVKDRATPPQNHIDVLNDGARPHMIRETAIHSGQGSATIADSADKLSNQPTRKRRRADDELTNASGSLLHSESDGTNDSMQLQSDRQRNAITSKSIISPQDYSEAWKREAFEAALGNNPSDWNDITLVSVSGHQEREEEL
jgi:hypothetical protein